MLECGVFQEFPTRKGLASSVSFAEGFELVDVAERGGADALWLAELHFQPAQSVLGAPMAVASAIAACTTRIKLGVAVQLLPLADPLRTAEEVATVDQISKGRLIFGVGRSGLATTYEACGVPYGESRGRFEEALDVILQAWTAETVSHEGTFYHSYNNVAVMPKPYQSPHPEIRVAASSASSFPTYGTRGYSVFADLRPSSIEELAPSTREYRAAFQAAGHTSGGGIYARIPMHLAETTEQAREEVRDYMMGFFHDWGRRQEEVIKRPGYEAPAERLARAKKMQALTWEGALNQKVVVGSPALVAERLLQLQEELSLDGVLAEFNCGGQIPHALVRQATRLYCDEVLPRLRRA